MATLNLHTAPLTDDSTDDGVVTRRTTRYGRRRRRGTPPPFSAYTLGIATVCSLIVVDLVAGEPAATASPRTQSVAVAEALGIDDSSAEVPAAEERELLGQLATSRAQRDAEQAAALTAQAQAEQAAAQAQAEAAARAAAEAAAAEEAAKAAEEAAQAAASTARTAVAKITNSAGPVRPQTQAAADAVVSNVPGAAGITIGGTRASATDPNGHPSGLALDYMTLSDIDLGNAIVQYHIANWDAFGVEYLIYRQRILSSPDGAWKSMEDRGSPTQNHMDHVNVKYRG